jgi:hypothetical protein
MKRLSVVLVLALLVSMLLVSTVAQADTGQENACWGQASAVFARFDEEGMGDHSSTQETPRLGLRNLARALADAGVIPDDSMQSLGVFVATAEGLSIEACGTNFE